MADEQYVVELRVDLQSNISAQLSQQLGAANQQFSGFDRQIESVQRALTGADASNQRMAQGLSTTRYALFDASRMVGLFGGALLALPVAIYSVAIAWEKNFADVIRTTGATGGAIESLKKDFMDLASSIPVSSAELAKIGAIAGQLGIPLKSVANFTETVAKFAATTDVSAEKASTSLGRIASLIPGINGDFEALGSSILNVGVKSLAGEKEILALTTQLSGLSREAGLTAGATIGLSAALASVGGQPELSRGAISRLFGQMSKSITENSDQLQTFARISGVTADEFIQAWGSEKFDDIFLGFVNGLDNIGKSGGSVRDALSELGINSQRDLQLLSRLATAANSAGESGKLLNQTMKDAKDGFSEATALSNQYAIIQGTVSAKLQLVTNNFENLMVVIGQGGGVFGGFLDIISNTLRVLTDLARNPVANFFLQLGVILSGLVGVLALLGAAALATLGGIAALTQAMVGMSAASGGAGVSLASLTAIMASTGTAGRVAATGINLAVTAIKGLSVVGLVGAVAGGLFALSEAVINFAEDSFYAGQGADSTGEKIRALATKIQESGILAEGAGGKAEKASTGFQAMGASFDTGVDSGGQYLSMLSELALKSGDAGEAVAIVSDAAKLTGVSFEDLLGKLPQVKQMLDEQGLTLQQNAEGLYEVRDATGELANSEELAKEKAESLAASLGITGDQLSDFQSNIQKTSQGFIDYGAIIESTSSAGRTWAEEQAVNAGMGKEAWALFADGTAIDLGRFSEQLQLQINAQQAWATNVGIIASQGATSFATELARMGPEGAAVAAAAVNATSQELMGLEEQARIAAFLSSSEFANQFTENIPLMMAAWRAGGIEAVRELVRAQMSKAPGAVQEVMDKFNLHLRGTPAMIQGDNSDVKNKANEAANYASNTKATIRLTADNSAALATIRDLQNQANVPLNVRPNFLRAEGGPIYGPGTATSDSIPAMLSNGEYVIKAATVSKYGMGFMNALNQGRVRQYAAGGSVSSSSSSGDGGSPGIGGIVELGPRTLNRMNGMGSGSVNIMLDDVALSRAVQRGNEARRRSGEM